MKRIERGGFVDDWRKAWKWFSVQGIAFLSIAPVLYENLDFVQAFLPVGTFHGLMASLGAATLVSRLVKQS